MTPHVIDTNVLAVANGRHGTASPGCVEHCVSYLQQMKASGLVLIDDGRRILDEYRDNLWKGGQPRAGWAFYKWLCDHPKSGHLRSVHITPVPGSDDNFMEFPSDPSFAGFDRGDRKFVAVAIASGLHPRIANAVDSDWADYDSALAAHSVRLLYLCLDHYPPRSPLT